MALDIGKFIAACREKSEKVTLVGKSTKYKPELVIIARTPDGQIMDVIPTKELVQEGKTEAQVLGERLLPIFKKFYPLYTEDADGNIVRVQEQPETPVDVDIPLEALLEVAKEFGLTG